MSKYTAERVLEYVEKAERGYFNPVHMEMLRDYAALLRERESAKVPVTDEIFEAFDAAQTKAMGEYEMQQYHAGKESHLVKALDFATRAALEAVAPMLASARVLELENALRMVVAANAMLSEIEGGKTLYEGSPTHSTPCLLAWSNLNTAIANAKQALAAAPKPETIWPKNAREKAFSLAREMLKKGSAKPEKE